MDTDKIIQKFSHLISELEQAHKQINDQWLSMEEVLNKSLEDQSAMNIKLKECLAGKQAGNGALPTVMPPPAPVETGFQNPLQKPSPEPVDPVTQLERMLQGSLDVLGDKISNRLMATLKELRSLPVEMRAAKIQEVKQMADAELVDLSALYKHEPVESNIEEVGVHEKESKGMDTNLEKLRALRRGKPKP